MTNHNILYRIYDIAGVLLYVGATTNLTMRIQDHAGTQPWWDEAADIKLQRFDVFEDLIEAETAAIQTEDPKYNILHAQLPVWSYKPRSARGGGSFYRRHNGLWVGRLELPIGKGGRRKRVQVTSRDRNTALQKFEALKLKAAHLNEGKLT